MRMPAAAFNATDRKNFDASFALRFRFGHDRNIKVHNCKNSGSARVHQIVMLQIDAHFRANGFAAFFALSCTDASQNF